MPGQGKGKLWHRQDLPIHHFRRADISVKRGFLMNCLPTNQQRATFKYFIIKIFNCQNHHLVVHLHQNRAMLIDLFLDIDSFYNCIPQFSSERSD